MKLKFSKCFYILIIRKFNFKYYLCAKLFARQIKKMWLILRSKFVILNALFQTLQLRPFSFREFKAFATQMQILHGLLLGRDILLEHLWIKTILSWPWHEMTREIQVIILSGSNFYNEVKGLATHFEGWFSQLHVHICSCNVIPIEAAYLYKISHYVFLMMKENFLKIVCL